MIDAGANPLVAIRSGFVRQDLLTSVLEELLSFEAGAKVLDVGCGVGNLAAWFAARVTGGVIGVDFSAPTIACAVRQARDAATPNLAFLQGDAYHLPVHDGTVDVVVGKSVLCVLRDIDGAVREMRRAVKPGGLVISIEPASAHLFHDPDDNRFADLSSRLNRAFVDGWRRRGVDQQVGLRVPSVFLKHGLEHVVVEVVSRVHVLADALRSPIDVAEQLETESYELPQATVSIVTDGGMSREELREHNQRARARLKKYRDNPYAAAHCGYARLAPAQIVTIGVRPQPS